MSASVLVAPARLGLVLTAILAVPVIVFFCFAAFDPAGLAAPISAGSPVTIWYAYGLGLIAFSLLLGLIYVIVANRLADRSSSVRSGCFRWRPPHTQPMWPAPADRTSRPSRCS